MSDKLTPEEFEALVAAWEKARRATGGGVVFIPRGVGVDKWLFDNSGKIEPFKNIKFPTPEDEN